MQLWRFVEINLHESKEFCLKNLLSFYCFYKVGIFGMCLLLALSNKALPGASVMSFWFHSLYILWLDSLTCYVYLPLSKILCESLKFHPGVVTHAYIHNIYFWGRGKTSDVKAQPRLLLMVNFQNNWEQVQWQDVFLVNLVSEFDINVN